jgi:hypothetical protein
MKRYIRSALLELQCGKLPDWSGEANEHRHPLLDLPGPEHIRPNLDKPAVAGRVEAASFNERASSFVRNTSPIYGDQHENACYSSHRWSAGAPDFLLASA